MRLIQAPKSVWQNPIHYLAFGFGAGAMPIAPGTFGTIAAIPLYLMIQNWSILWYSIILIIAIFIGFKICGIAERDTGIKDNPGIVWDEIVGYGLTMLAAPHGAAWVILGFIFFRLFDIWKPQPIRWFNYNLSGGIGVVVDDLLAAIPAWVCLQILAHILLR